MSSPAANTVSATRSRTGGWRFWLSAHAGAAAEAGRHLRRRPGTYLVTVLVLATVLALPLAFYIALKNLDRVFAGMDSDARISVFLDTGAPERTLNTLLETLEADGRVAATEVITRDQAYADFSAREEFAAALAALDENPFPDLVVVTPADGLDKAALSGLVDELQARPGVGFAQLDLVWVERLQTITGLLERGVAAISVMLAVAVLAIVGNTIRLNIGQNRDAIAIARLVGATDAWIRRPYLYLGLYQGLAGALLAGLIVAAVLAYLAPLANRLSASYGLPAAVAGVAPAEAMALLAAGVTLGLGAAWLAVISQLRSLD